MKKNIGFIATRFCGTDGVTMEAGKWAEVLRKAGNQCFWFAGQLDRKTVAKVEEILRSQRRRAKMGAVNYAIARRHYSYTTLRRWLNTILTNFFGIDVASS